MRAVVAKKLRGLVYSKDWSPRARFYERAGLTRTVRAVGTRRQYKDLKKAYNRGELKLT